MLGPRSLGLASIMVSIGCLWPQRAEAQGTYPDWAFGDPAGEIGTGVFAAASNFTYLIPQRISSWAPFLPWTYDPLLSKWSDMTGAFGGSMLQIGIGFAFEAGYLAYEGAAEPGVLALHQVAVEAEALALTSGITAFIKKISGRHRPRYYLGPTEDCQQCDAFPSGHTSVIGAFSGARLIRLFYTPPGTGFGIRASAWVLSDAALITTGTLRVLSGSHSWEDVLGGALFGYATGMAVALVHPNLTLSPLQRSPGALPENDAQARMTRVFSWGSAF